MHRELEAWKQKGRSHDHLGYEVFHIVEGSGPYLLLIHGYPFNSFDWNRIWPALTARFTVIAPDMLGMGFSDKPPRYDYSVHDHADMHLDLLAELGVKSAHILAHDIGDSVAQEILARREEARASGSVPGPRIESITWLNGGLFYESYRPRPIQTLLSTTPVGGLLARYGRRLIGESVIAKAISEVFGPGTKPSSELLAQFGQIMDYNDGRRVTHAVGRFVLDRYHHRNRWVRAMRETDVPMRLINGPYDPNSGRHMADRYRELIPDPDIVLLESDIGHWPQLEAPAAVVAHFNAFIDRVTTPSPLP